MESVVPEKNCEEGGICNIPPSTDEDVTNATKPNNKSDQRKKKSQSATITTLHGQQDFDAFISANDNVIVEFMTDWCTACQGIEDYYEDLSMSHREDENVRTAKVVCDKNKQTKKLAAVHNVRSYPVFVVFQGGSVVTRWDGADTGKLESAFERLAGGGRKKKRGGRRR